MNYKQIADVLEGITPVKQDFKSFLISYEPFVYIDSYKVVGKTTSGRKKFVFYLYIDNELYHYVQGEKY